MKSRTEIKLLMSKLHNLYSSDDRVDEAFALLDQFQRESIEYGIHLSTQQPTRLDAPSKLGPFAEGKG